MYGIGIGATAACVIAEPEDNLSVRPGVQVDSNGIVTTNRASMSHIEGVGDGIGTSRIPILVDITDGQ